MLSFMEELMSKSFVGENMKEAYMKAVKWYATNVLAKDELRGICVMYEKIYDEQSPTVVIHLYVSMVEEEVRERHCQICKEFHHSFFINEAENCNSCNVSGYQKRLEQNIKIKRDFYRDLLRERGI